MADATVVFNQSFLGQAVRNVTVWSNVTEDVDDLQAFADALRGVWAASLATTQLTQWELRSITFIFNETLPIFSLNVPFTLGFLAGQLTDDPIPTQNALLVSTQFFGVPPNRGRVYFAGFGDNQVTSAGLFATATVDEAAAMVESWADGISASGNTYFLRIARRNVDGTLDVSSPVSTVVGRTNPATIRRRRIGSGQ